MTIIEHQLIAMLSQTRDLLFDGLVEALLIQLDG
jgi:hypothetical protein